MALLTELVAERHAAEGFLKPRPGSFPGVDRPFQVREVAGPLSELPHQVRVEGHTDDTPISTSRFRSNWELSTARATQVIAYLQNDLAIPATRLSAAGYAEFHPRVPNTSAAARSQNRRVDLIILNGATRAAEEPAAR